MNEKISPSADRKSMNRSKKMLAELTLYENTTEDVCIFSEVKFTRSGDSCEVKAVGNREDNANGLFSLKAEGEDTISLIVDRLLPIYLVNRPANGGTTFDTAIMPECTLPTVASTCRSIKNTLSEKGGELDVEYAVSLAHADVYHKRIHLTLREDNRR